MIRKFNFLKNKNLLITGGTGSFGSSLAYKLLKYSDINKIIIFSRDEQKQYRLKKILNSEKIRFFLGDIRDKQRLREAIDEVDYIIHAAALKHVDIAEYNPFEAVKTNIIGTQNIIETALEKNVKKVIVLSTDKAVSPINLYGSTKLSAEKLMVSANNFKGNKKIAFSVVRYGNVLNSNGSVYKYFKELKNNNTKVFPITDFAMTRFFISIDQSLDFVLNSLNLSEGGEVFIPKMKSIKIVDLAKIIEPSVKLKKIGIRPGEKIHEKLFSADESDKIYDLGNFFVLYSDTIFSFGNKIKNLPRLLKNKKKTKFINGYGSDNALTTWTLKKFNSYYGIKDN